MVNGVDLDELRNRAIRLMLGFDWNALVFNVSNDPSVIILASMGCSNAFDGYSDVTSLKTIKTFRATVLSLAIYIVLGSHAEPLSR